MPLIASNPWQDAAQAGSGFGAQIAQMLAQQPQLRLQLAQMGQQALVNKSKIGEQDASAGLYKAQAENEQLKTKQEGGQPGGITDALRALIANNPQAFATAAGPATGFNPHDPAGQLSLLASMIGANPAQNPNVAAQIQGAKPTVVPANAVAFNPMGGAPMMGAELLRPGSSIQPPGGQMQVSPVAPPQRSDLGALGNLLSGVPKNVESGMMSPDAGSNMLQQLILPALTNALQRSQGGQQQQQLQGQQPGPRRVSSQQEYDALPNGSQYIDDSGHTKTKGVK